MPWRARAAPCRSRAFWNFRVTGPRCRQSRFQRRERPVESLMGMTRQVVASRSKNSARRRAPHKRSPRARTRGLHRFAGVRCGFRFDAGRHLDVEFEFFGDGVSPWQTMQGSGMTASPPQGAGAGHGEEALLIADLAAALNWLQTEGPRPAGAAAAMARRRKPRGGESSLRFRDRRWRPRSPRSDQSADRRRAAGGWRGECCRPRKTSREEVPKMSPMSTPPANGPPNPWPAALTRHGRSVVCGALVGRRSTPDRPRWPP